MRNPTHRLAKLSITVSYKIKHKQEHYESDPHQYFNINKVGQKPFVMLFMLNNLFLKMTNWSWTRPRGGWGGGRVGGVGRKWQKRGDTAKESTHGVDVVGWGGGKVCF